MQQRNSNVYVIDGDGRRGAGARTANGEAQRGRRSAPPRAGAHGGWPRFAASSSMLVSGTGHFLHRRWGAGFFYLGAFTVAIGVHVALATFWPRIVALSAGYQVDELDLLFGLLMFDVLTIAALLAGVYGAHAVGHACGGDAGSTPHPVGPALASLLVPGWGQIVNGQIAKALAFLAPSYAGVLAVAAWWVIPEPVGRLLSRVPQPFQPTTVVFGLISLALVVWSVSLYDAALVARYRRSAPEPASRRARRPAATSTRLTPAATR